MKNSSQKCVFFFIIWLNFNESRVGWICLYAMILTSYEDALQRWRMAYILHGYKDIYQAFMKLFNMRHIAFDYDPAELSAV